MTRDPRFPDRPDHPDFWRLSRAVIGQDNLSDLGAPTEDVLKRRGVESVESVLYMASQRVTRAMGHNFVSPQNKAFLMSIYLDAFCAGAGFVQDQETLLDALHAVDNGLRNGSNMTKANIGFDELCKRLGIERDLLNNDAEED